MKKFLAVSFASLALLFTTAPAWASDDVTPEMRVVVEQLLDTMRFNDMALKTMDQMSQMLPTIMRQSAMQAAKTGRQLSASDEAKVNSLLEKFIPEAAVALRQVITDPAMIKEMRMEMAPLYARYYTLDEVRGLTAFYASPLGRKMISVMPQLSVDSIAISQRVMMPRVDAVMQPLLKKMLSSQ
ncbi:DUF2059 domain-containing protein [Janthinobacterium sp. RB2R34]|uniref:DUF2059 domain-containing protein n=1 Tax=Janthinobacterium sp. RB2R34 TaxID=3424193 RepID=UPI003F2300FF